MQQRLITSNFTKGGNSRLGIVIHTQVGTLDGTDAWFHNPASSVSAQYGIDLDGPRTYQWVLEENQAYAQGIVDRPTFQMVLDRPGVNPNSYLISIECADNGNPAGADRTQQYPVLIALVQDICTRNNIPIDRQHICGHHEIRFSKTCPGNIDVEYVVQQARKGQTPMSTLYKGLDLSNPDSMKVAVDVWDQVVNQKLYIKQKDADSQCQLKLNDQATELATAKALVTAKNAFIDTIAQKLACTDDQADILSHISIIPTMEDQLTQYSKAIDQLKVDQANEKKSFLEQIATLQSQVADGLQQLKDTKQQLSDLAKQVKGNQQTSAQISFFSQILAKLSAVFGGK